MKPNVPQSRQLQPTDRVTAKVDGDTGRVIETDYRSDTGREVRVAWDQGIETWTEHSNLRKG